MVWVEPYIYFGTGEFSKKILAGLVDCKLQPALVVSTSSKPAGRGLRPVASPVAEYAASLSLPLVLVNDFKSDLPTELKRTTTRFAILAAFGKIIPVELMARYELGIINVHPSLLPKYRGASPIQTALLDGIQETGVTLIRLDEQVDHGPIISQYSLTVGPDDDALQLETRLARLAIAALLTDVPSYLSGEITPRPQRQAEATYTKKITREDGRADFNLQAATLNQRRRAFTPWPGLWTFWHGRRLKLLMTSSLDKISLSPGQVARVDNAIVVGCALNTALALEKIQLAGGQPLSAEIFVRGHRNFIGSRLPS